MHIVCLDLEGVLVPEIWLAVAERTGIAELRLTTRDIPDYDVLMKKRIAILGAHNITLSRIQQVIDAVEPLEGACDFLDLLRSKTQLIILSDTFTQFARPLMEKLGRPTLFCNELVVHEDRIVDYRLRQANGKRHAVRALKSMGFEVLASGDSYNDIGMLQEADHGVLFRPPERIIAEYPGFPAFTEYRQLSDMIELTLAG